MTIRSGCMAAGIALLSFGAAYAQSAATGEGDKTLYTYDKDAGGASACYQQCATNWPPYLAGSDTAMEEGWTTVQRADGTMQMAYDGKPTYYYIGDAKPGDVTGDGKGGVWHVLMK